MNSRNSRARLQDLRTFTVQIRHTNSDKVVGTGFLVSTEGQIVTAAHVVRDAGVDPYSIGAEDLGVYLPHVGIGSKAWRASVAACFTSYDDDVILLQLTDRLSLASEQVAVLGTADLSEGHNFLSYGFQRLGSYPSGRAAGRILGSVTASDKQTVKTDPIELRTRDIRPGMSGAAVLDTERNLVVGIISTRWNPGDTSMNDDIGWAVDACVLAFTPMNLPVQDEPYPLKEAPTPITTEVEQTESNVGVLLKYAPPPVEEWVGRADLLKAISADWATLGRRMAGLIGFGGEGKSSLARRWVQTLLESSDAPQYDGMFWWSFYDNSNVDDFFAAALAFIGKGGIDPQQYLSSYARAHLIAALLTKGRYVFVLDGMEVMQHQDGDSYGLVINRDLSSFLQFFGAPTHESFCLVSSRAPLLDLINYTTYVQHNVERLSVVEGRDLLNKLGVKGPNVILERIVTSWDGYALVLSLLGTYLVQQHDGDVSHIDDVAAPTENEPRYARVYRVLCRYDEYLTEAERALLMLLSMFRTAVNEAALRQVIQVEPNSGELGAPISALGKDAYKGLLERLISRRLLRYNAATNRYTMHPVIRAYYHDHLSKCDPDQVRKAHTKIRDYYLSIARLSIRLRTLEELAPLIEAVHHSGQAEDYEGALRILWQRVNLRGLIARLPVIGASEANLQLISGFFPQGDISGDPLVSNQKNAKYWILNEMGVCLAGLGRLGEASSLYERAIQVALEREDWGNAATSYENVALTYALLGRLDTSSDRAEQARHFARLKRDKERERNALCGQAWIAHLRGDLQTASLLFRKAEYLERSTSGFNYLNQRNGTQYCDHLRRTGKLHYARRVAEVNLEIMKRFGTINTYLGFCHDTLGDLNAEEGRQDRAHFHYNEALKIARNVSQRDLLIEALLRRGYNSVRINQVEAAYGDLSEALFHAVAGGYRIYEADIRTALSWAHHLNGDRTAAQTEVELAQDINSETGYYWGQVDASNLHSVVWNDEGQAGIS